MAPRKDMMRIIRQDVGFSAKLGFGGPVAKTGDGGDDIGGAGDLIPVTEVATELAAAKAERASLEPDTVGKLARPLPTVQDRPRDEDSVSEAVARKEAISTGAATSPPTSQRGHVVYIAVSLTARQATLAECWANTARCSIQFLIRRVAQGLRDEVFEEWALRGMPNVDEPRGLRGKHPTSVTMTLRPDFAAELSKRHDPLQVLGLARIMGPAFRARFQVAFDQALAKAKIHTASEGDAE